jgi:hypothetical protein
MPGLTCAIHEPNFFPPVDPGQAVAADVWVIHDDVQFSCRDYQHRCYLPRPGRPARPLAHRARPPPGGAGPLSRFFLETEFVDNGRLVQPASPALVSDVGCRRIRPPAADARNRRTA